jgi:hypothetical protein
VGEEAGVVCWAGIGYFDVGSRTNNQALAKHKKHESCKSLIISIFFLVKIGVFRIKKGKTGLRMGCGYALYAQ